MFINNNKFDTQELTHMNNLRALIFKNLYPDPTCIESLINSISKYIENLSAEYDPIFYTITIKIKKTGLRKTFGRSFLHTPEFYYNFIPDIFYDFLINNPDIRSRLINIISSIDPNPYDVLNNITLHKNLFVNLCHISCMSDNIIVMKL